MSTFVRYIDEVEVTSGFGANGIWATIDLEPYLDDSSAIGVILRATNVDVPTGSGAWRETGGADTGFFKLLKFTYASIALSLVGGTSIDFKRSVAEVRLFITGEIHDNDGIVLYDDRIIYNFIEAQHGIWQDVQPTPQGGDSLDDIIAVIVGVVSADNITMGIRTKGSINAPRSFTAECGSDWRIVGVDENGYYQLYTTGKAGFDTGDAVFYETGYIKNGSGVVTILDSSDLDLLERSTWQPKLYLGNVGEDPFDIVPDGTILAGCTWHCVRQTEPICTRAIGSSENLGIQLWQGSEQTQIVLLDEDETGEYILGPGNETPPLSGHEMYVDWYEEPVVVPSGADIGWLAGQIQKRNQLHQIRR